MPKSGSSSRPPILLSFCKLRLRNFLLDYDLSSGLQLVDRGHSPVSIEVAQYMCELNIIAFHHVPFLPQHLELSSCFSQNTASILSVCVMSAQCVWVWVWVWARVWVRYLCWEAVSVYVTRVCESVVCVHHVGVSTNPESPGRAQRLLLDGVVESKGQGFGARMILN